jgi:hypothetical protein
VPFSIVCVEACCRSDGVEALSIKEDRGDVQGHGLDSPENGKTVGGDVNARRRHHEIMVGRILWPTTWPCEI